MYNERMNTSIKGQRFRKEECVYWGCTEFIGRDRFDVATVMFRHKFYWRRHAVWLYWNTAVRVNARVNSDCDFSFTPLEDRWKIWSGQDPELRVTRGKVTNAIAES